jgi:raffinose/stachyose/melibiose transport system substrate-binding protein
MSAAIPAGSEKEEAAWRLIKWLTGKEVETLGVNHAAYAAGSRTDINPADLVLEPIQKATANFLSNDIKHATAVFDGVFDSEVANVMNDVLMEIGLGSKTPQQAATAVQKAFDDWKAKN